MDSSFKIETAKPQQLDDICELIQNSIITPCAEDHLKQSHHIEAWLADRSVERLEHMLFSNESQSFVCLDNEYITGIVQIATSGKLELCYVHPEYIGQGIGRLILETAETQVQEWG